MSGRNKSRIFINYRRGDAAGIAGRLADTLGRYFGDDRVFRDVDGIEGGSNFEDVLKRTAQAADAMIVLIGRDWVNMTNQNGQRRLHDPDDWVAREISAALERKIPIFPVLIEDASMPRAEDLPEVLKPLVRHNAISVSDTRWHSDVTRLAKIVAIDIPGSAAERILQWVRWVISAALFVAVSLTVTIVGWNVAHQPKGFIQGGSWPLELWQSGITFVVIVGSSMLLLAFAHLVDESKRWFVYASGLIGLSGSCAGFIWLAFLDDAKEPIAMFSVSTVTAMAVVVVMNLSGFKAK
jgi:hypothetical protein